MKRGIAQYLNWIALLTGVLAIFGVGIIVVGYKPLSLGRGATIFVLALATFACLYASKRGKSQ